MFFNKIGSAIHLKYEFFSWYFVYLLFKKPSILTKCFCPNSNRNFTSHMLNVGCSNPSRDVVVFERDSESFNAECSPTCRNSTQKISHCSMAMSDEYKIITAGKMKLTVHVHVKWYQIQHLILDIGFQVN